MAKVKVFAVFDSKADAYLQPFFMSTLGQAIRSFTDAAASTDHQFGKHAADYTLFHLGDFDDATGKFTDLLTPVSLGSALEVVSALRNKPN
jgi:hypothetical protein